MVKTAIVRRLLRQDKRRYSVDVLGNTYLPTLFCFGRYILDTFQDFLIAEHMKPRMHILEISISSLNHVIVRPTKTPKVADKKCA